MSNYVIILKDNGKARAKFIVLSQVPAVSHSQPQNALKAQLTYHEELNNLVEYIIGACRYENGTLHDTFFVGGGAEDVRAPAAYWGEEESVRSVLFSLKHYAILIICLVRQIPFRPMPLDALRYVVIMPCM